MADTATRTPQKTDATPTRRSKGTPLGSKKSVPVREKAPPQMKSQPEETFEKPHKKESPSADKTPQTSESEKELKKSEKKDEVEDEEQSEVDKVEDQDDEQVDSQATDDEDDAPFEDFPDPVVEKDGKVVSQDRVVGKVVEGPVEELVGKRVDPAGDVLDDESVVVGKARVIPEDVREEAQKTTEEAKEAKEEVEEEEDLGPFADFSGLTVKKDGTIVTPGGDVVGKLKEGDPKKLFGKTVNAKGEVVNAKGDVLGQAERNTDDDEEGPFANFPGSTVRKDGLVVNAASDVVGKIIEGDIKKLYGKSVEESGEILDRNKNVIGKAERYEEEEPEEAKEDGPFADFPASTVKKDGTVVTAGGDVVGKLVQGDAKTCFGKTIDEFGIVKDRSGNQIGKAERYDEEDEEGPFANFPGATVGKDGKIRTSSGDVVGKLREGDAAKLFGKAVQESGDIVDRNGKKLGEAERWEEEEVKKDVSPMSGRKVNKQGVVVDENGDVIGKLTEGDVSKCAGKAVDDDGDVIDSKGVIGHVTLLADLPEEKVEEEEAPKEPEESPEEKAKREQLEQDKKLATQMSNCIQQSLEKVKPIMKMIDEKIDNAERTPKEELDEQKLVDEVKPLIEEGGRILTEANGVIRGLDPDGRISANAKHKTAAREASPEEYRLADLLKDLTGTVTETIDKAKKKISGMPHAKKELNPLWGLLSEPLAQILAAVGLLLSGVLGLVGKLLNGLGLGGLVNNLLGGLGLTKVLDGLGLGSILAPITGQKKK